MRQRQPDASKLSQTGIARVEDTARNPQMRDRIPIQQQIAPPVAEKKRDKGENDCNQGDGKGLFPCCRTHLVNRFS